MARYAGRIDRKMFGSISECITTEEVIITEEQIQHIQERHPRDYERFVRYSAQILAAPDYIIEANKPHSAVLLKTIAEDGRIFKLVLRLRVLSDADDRKNAVITFMHIDEKDYARLLRNKKILYKRV